MTLYILKIVRGDTLFCHDMDEFKRIFDVKSNHYVYPKRKADLDELSESNLECINESIEENKYLSFKQLRDKSHDDEAYRKATKDDKIHFDEIAKAGGADDSLISYLESASENDRIFAA